MSEYGGSFCPLFFSCFLCSILVIYYIFVNGLKLTVSLSCYTHAGWRLDIICVVLIVVLFLECNIGMTIDCCTVCQKHTCSDLS
jgi:hypothetical protein